MKIIALTGNSNCGKSHTINLVYQLLLNTGWVPVQGNFQPLGNPTQEDFTDVLSKGNVRVGIVSMGDHIKPPNDVKTLVENLINKGCDCIFCACTTVNPIALAYIMTHRQYIVISKTERKNIEEHRIANGKDANQMFVNL